MVLAGCASNEALQVELSRLRQEVHGLRSTLALSDERLQAVEGKVDLLSADRRRQKAAMAGGSRQAVSSAPTGPSSRDRISEEAAATRRLPVVRMTAPGQAAVESSGFGAVDNGEPPVMIRIRGQRSERLSVDRDVLARPDPVLDAPATPERSYRVALDTLRESKDPSSALPLFRSFLRKNPRHHLADNALYWMGESHQMLGQHAEAIAVWDRLLERHPRSNKVAWAKLRIAESYLALGQDRRGRALLQRLREDHPKSEPARLARAKLEALATVK